MKSLKKKGKGSDKDKDQEKAERDGVPVPFIVCGPYQVSELNERGSKGGSKGGIKDLKK